MIGSEAVEQWKRLAPHRYHDWTRSTWWAMVGGSRFVFHAELKRVEVRVLQHETKSGEFAGSTAQFGCGLPRHNAAKRIIPFDSRPVLPLHTEAPLILIAPKKKGPVTTRFLSRVTGPEPSGQVNLSQWRGQDSIEVRFLRETGILPARALQQALHRMQPTVGLIRRCVR